METDYIIKSDLFSHPFVYIEDHINRCLELAKFFIEENIPILSEDLKTALIVSVALHDFGKTTSYFQEYIKAKMNDINFNHPYLGKRKLTEHSFLGGVYAFYVSKKLLSESLISFFMFVACKRHHTNPRNFLAESSELDDEDTNFLKKQISSIDENKANTFISKLSLPQNIKNAIYFQKKEFLNNIEEVVLEIVNYKRYFRESLRGECRTNIKDFLTFQYLFSILLDSDKTEAGAKQYKPERYKIPPFVVDEYKKRKFKQNKEIDKLRKEAFKEVLNQTIDISSKVYSITLPTGIGKTLTGFAFALKLRDEIYKEKGYWPRIIYSLPFLSIIDQNAEILREVLSCLGEVKTSVLLKHHHLSDKNYNEYDYSASRLLTEGWNSEIIITTFVQLFHTLFGWRNSEIRRFNKLAGSILIIDEVQAIPHKYWHLLRNILEEISKNLGSYIILMTATQPYLIPDAKELAKTKYLAHLDRINLKVVLEPQTIEEFVGSFVVDPNKTYLFICNTISSSKKLYKKLKEKTNGKVGYLSTAITPYERKERIREIKKGNYRIVVSTQLIEAGVDIDFDVVIRDFAPMDSIIQSAGRCNRNMEKGKGEFMIVKLKNEEGKYYCYYIYDILLITETEKLLKDKTIISEPEFMELCSQYFINVWNKISADESKNIEKAVKCLKFDGEGEDVLSCFELIKDEIYKQDVFVEVNEESKKAWKRAKEILNALKSRNINIFQAKEEFEKLKPLFYNFVISVDIRKNQPIYDNDLNIYYILYESLEMFYDKETGFKEEGDPFLDV